MSNETVTSLPGWDSLPQYVSYILFGLTVGGANLVIMLCICRYEALRASKVHLIMLSLAYADFANMAATAIAGVWRTYTVLRGTHDTLVTPWSCALLPQTLVWVLVGDHGSAIQLLVVSIDRLLATAWPLQYIGWSRRAYITSVVVVSHGWAMVTGLLGLSLAYLKRSEKSVKAYCSSTSAMIAAGQGTWFPAYYTLAAGTFSSASIVVYLLVYKRKQNQIGGNNLKLSFEMAQERKLTRTLGYSCVCTLFLYTLPIFVANRLRWAGVSNWGSLFFALSNLNPFMNLLLYQFHQPEMRQALSGLVKCKQMPIDVKQWKVNAAHTRQQQQINVL